MKNRFVSSMLAFGLVLFLSFTLFTFAQGQRSAPAGAAARGAAPAANAGVDVNGKKFNPHDFSGIWIRRGGNRAYGPPNSWPPLTAEGDKLIKSRIPTPGYNR